MCFPQQKQKCLSHQDKRHASILLLLAMFYETRHKNMSMFTLSLDTPMLSFTLQSSFLMAKHIGCKKSQYNV